MLSSVARRDKFAPAARCVSAEGGRLTRRQKPRAHRPRCFDLQTPMPLCHAVFDIRQLCNRRIFYHFNIHGLLENDTINLLL